MIFHFVLILFIILFYTVKNDKLAKVPILFYHKEVATNYDYNY